PSCRQNAQIAAEPVALVMPNGDIIFGVGGARFRRRARPMISRQLSAFRGELSAKDVAEGINASIRNAKRLAADAKLMLDAKRYPTAAALAILSIEETEKVPTLRALSVARTKEELTLAWEDYRSHRVKNTAWI